MYKYKNEKRGQMSKYLYIFLKMSIWFFFNITIFLQNLIKIYKYIVLLLFYFNYNILSV